MLHYKDIRDVGETQVVEWRSQFPGVKSVISDAGWPCQDLSGANPQRKALAGKRSGLFFELVRLWKTLSRVWRGARLHRMGEKVQRMLWPTSGQSTQSWASRRSP